MFFLAQFHSQVKTKNWSSRVILTPSIKLYSEFCNEHIHRYMVRLRVNVHCYKMLAWLDSLQCDQLDLMVSSFPLWEYEHRIKFSCNCLILLLLFPAKVWLNLLINQGMRKTELRSVVATTSVFLIPYQNNHGEWLWVVAYVGVSRFLLKRKVERGNSK